MSNFHLDGWFADFAQHNFYFGTIRIEEGRVVEIRETGARRLTWSDRSKLDRLILPGLVDSHVHIESSMLLPSRFAREAVRFGTVATVSDPHEIANVLGLEGIGLMLEDAAKACIKIYFTAPSCVPATMLETAGAILNAVDLEPLFSEKKVVALGEMMNYPGVLAQDAGVIAKINLAKKYGKPVDGHAPGLSGEALQSYIDAGISTDHECSTIAEAEEKIKKGMKVLIREGSSARNFDQLVTLIDRYPDMVMLCSDDLHPDDLLKGHIDRLIRRGLEAGMDFFNLYRAASLNPVEHYGLETGLLQPGDPADFIISSGVEPFRVTSTYLNGEAVFKDSTVHFELPAVRALNQFQAVPVLAEDLVVKGETGNYRVIRAYDGELLTGAETTRMLSENGVVEPDLSQDILKIVVLNRYVREKPAIAWISGFGLKKGAMASSIAHDSHNIIAVGTSDKEIAAVINQIILHQGGISASDSGMVKTLPLPVAGLMSLAEAGEVGVRYAELSRWAKELGSTLKAPFMALSFMALLVIPHLKIGDRGLFNCDTFEFTDLKAD
jgi:adenine deaminase